MTDLYKLLYWPSIQGRGEFVRLVLEAADVRYVDLARWPAEQGGDVPTRLRELQTSPQGLAPLAPPILIHGDLVIAQTTNICLYLARRHNLVPDNDRAQLHANQLLLTIADLVAEVHNTHHPISSSLFYEDQRDEAARYTGFFLDQRVPKFLGYFERVLIANGGEHMQGGALSCVDLAMFQVLSGLAFAFPRRWDHLEPTYPHLVALRDRVADTPNVAAYLASDRRLPFNADGIFRNYPELDTLPEA